MDQQGVWDSGVDLTQAVEAGVAATRAGRVTSDAGLLPLAQFDRRWQFTERMAGCIPDSRQDLSHSVLEMIRQRPYGIIADYEDCNDHDDLRDDPLFQQVIGKAVGEGAVGLAADLVAV